MPKDVKKEIRTKSLTRAKTMEGNSNGLKLRDSDIRQEAYKQYCDHIASGKPKQTWYGVFEGPPRVEVTWETMDSYIKNNPTEFPTFLMKAALSKRYEEWMEHGRKLMIGAYKGGSPVVWQTIMRNMFRDISWDRDIQTSYHNETDAQKAIKVYESPQASK